MKFLHEDLYDEFLPKRILIERKEWSERGITQQEMSLNHRYYVSNDFFFFFFETEREIFVFPKNRISYIYISFDVTLLYHIRMI